MELAIEDTPEGATVALRVQPRAQPEGLAGVREGRLVVRVGAAPLDGRANDAVVRLLAKALGVPRATVALVAGERSRDKRVRVAGVAADELRRRLAEVTGG